MTMRGVNGCLRALPSPRLALRSAGPMGRKTSSRAAQQSKRLELLEKSAHLFQIVATISKRWPPFRPRWSPFQNGGHQNLSGAHHLQKVATKCSQVPTIPGWWPPFPVRCPPFQKGGHYFRSGGDLSPSGGHRSMPCAGCFAASGDGTGCGGRLERFCSRSNPMCRNLNTKGFDIAAAEVRIRPKPPHDGVAKPNRNERTKNYVTRLLFPKQRRPRRLVGQHRHPRDRRSRPAAFPPHNSPRFSPMRPWRSISTGRCRMSTKGS